MNVLLVYRAQVFLDEIEEQLIKHQNNKITLVLEDEPRVILSGYIISQIEKHHNIKLDINIIIIKET